MNIFKKVTAAYFSATGTNERSVNAIASGFAEDYIELNLTKRQKYSDVVFDKGELLVVGAPVYGGRIYKGALERFKCLKGNNTSCIVTVTYGNRHYDDALIELADVMKSQGFEVVAAAAMVGQHTYGEIQVGRPDENDIESDRVFAKSVIDKCEREPEESWSDFVIPGNRPYKDGGNGSKFRPFTTDKCTHCGICVEKCPENAIGDDFRTIDDTKCIGCFACIRNCPVNAKIMTDQNYIAWADDFSKKLAVKRDNEYYM